MCKGLITPNSTLDTFKVLNHCHWFIEYTVIVNRESDQRYMINHDAITRVIQTLEAYEYEN